MHRPATLLGFVCMCWFTPGHADSSSFLAGPPLLSPKISEAVRQFMALKPIVFGNLGKLEGTPQRDEEFDYIVVGGGTAGNAIGVRLAEAGSRVAIVEAGAFYEIGKPVLGTTPGGDLFGIGADIDDSVPAVDWKFQTVPQAGANNRKVHIARGKCLGGSSALNFMIYHRGSKSSYDLWAKDVGDDTYRLSNFEKYFKKSVNFTPPNKSKRPANISDSTTYDPNDFLPTGKGGPVQVSYPNFVSPWGTWLEKGFQAIGLRKTDGFNKGQLIGYHYAQTTIRQSDATRSSSAEYVYSAQKKNVNSLKVFLKTHALKILFEDKTATGVKVQHKGSSYNLRAKKEVIVSAGAFQSPQLLMVSGIGPQDTLRRYNIPVISQLSGVGQNMWDHVFFGPSWPVKIPTLVGVLMNPVNLFKAAVEYLFQHAGDLSSNGLEFLGWEKLPEQYRQRFSAQTEQELAYFPADWPEVEYLDANGYIGNFGNLITGQPKDGKTYTTILGAVVAPISRGNVTIESANSLDSPVINPNWMTAKADQEVAVAWYRRMRDVWQSRPLQSIVDGEEKYPGENVQTDEQVLNTIRDSLMTVWHPACTCKMGKKSDPMAVVDNQARVFGVKGLRVVDASSMPLLPPGHPQSTIYALAEKIADDIIRGGQSSSEQNYG
ncbi:hypothetical protein HIM_06267 [Hirsutella minnesotensis 3608]|uniref:Glucose-methanol-choline oxidoreductase N-terminal domain-containing protein n=1 Tax=Hirsutella minnesotensis 3608 TaxID=1043627 RepID=A0A0F7ZJB1_9HYPO|nr:hypothetical protein HIM_06267 [Hirsutella minnesotensis 3608]